MKNFILSISAFSLMALYSCDKLENDVVPDDQNPIQLQENVFSMPNTPLIFDLKKSLVIAEKASLRTSVQPQKGKLSFMNEGFIKYSPNGSFLSGSDFFVMEALGSGGNILDRDTINITMVTDTTDLPCFNGALSDNVYTSVNVSKVFNVITNDGYCKDETNGAIVEIISEPANGEVSLIDLFTYVYTPDPDFQGSDSLIYSLELIDLDGNSHYSNALVNFHVGSLSDTCQMAFYDDYFYFETLENSFTLNVSANDYLCSGRSLEYFIHDQPSRGSAQIYFHPDSVFARIDYIPNDTSKYFRDSLTYAAYDENETLFQAKVIIHVDALGCTFNVNNDYYEISSDSISDGSISLDVLANDEICEWNGLEYGISGDNHSAGTASFTGGRMNYTLPDVVAGTDTVRYVVCESANCKTAEVFIDIYW